jgi:hypothetical protein
VRVRVPPPAPFVRSLNTLDCRPSQLVIGPRDAPATSVAVCGIETCGSSRVRGSRIVPKYNIRSMRQGV